MNMFLELIMLIPALTVLTVACLGIAYGLMYCLRMAFDRRVCDLCGRKAMCSESNGFELCKKCGHIAKASSIPLGDLIAQGAASRASQEGTARLTNAINSLVTVAVLLLAWLLIPSSVWQSLSPKPPLPVTIDARTSFVDQGMVLRLSNQSPRELTVWVEVQGNGRPKQEAKPVLILPNNAVELGWAEGFDFKLGDRVVLTNPIHEELAYVVSR